MSRKGENIYKRKDNRWEARYVKGYDEDGAIKYGYIYATTYTQAKDRLQKAKTDKDRDIVTKGQCFTQWSVNSGLFSVISGQTDTEAIYREVVGEGLRECQKSDWSQFCPKSHIVSLPLLYWYIFMRQRYALYPKKN